MPEDEYYIENEICPECGADLTNLDPVGHSLDHWPERIPDYPETRQARRRQHILREIARKRGLI